jgi:hypothetical protein
MSLKMLKAVEKAFENLRMGARVPYSSPDS